RHAILCLTRSGSFEQRLEDRDVPVIALDLPPGHRFGDYSRIWRALKSLEPAIVHTRNLSALEAQVPALFLPGVKRVHGVHGRDVFDLEGKNRKYNLLRKTLRPIVGRYTTVSKDLERWLIEVIGVAPHKVVQIYNGVDQERFGPGSSRPRHLFPDGFADEASVVIGTVGRLAEVKDQATLVASFARLLELVPTRAAERLRLVVVGDGPLRSELKALIQETLPKDRVWMTGDRDDIPDLLRLMDIFVLPSLAEGISNTILEAMASGLPVVATRVGGNAELVIEGVTGRLVAPKDPQGMAGAMADLVCSPERRRAMGQSGLEPGNS
ncbi:MAG TPA: glycosyltransferase, partial [Chromatiaceae bacterium]|nr:glycosyltransferase [Chromatiaceae bacterium]